MSSLILNHDRMLDDPKDRAEELAAREQAEADPDDGEFQCPGNCGRLITDSEACQCGACPECCEYPVDESVDEDLWEDYS